MGRCLAEVFDALTTAGTRDAARAARALADADGLCALSPDGERCRAENGGARTLLGKEDCVALSTGEQLRMGIACVAGVELDINLRGRAVESSRL